MFSYAHRFVLVLHIKSMLAISTPSSEGNMNFYTNMMEARDPNDPSKTMFKVLQISLACSACMEAGRASECTHSKLEFFFFAVAPRVLFLTLLSLCPLFSGEVPPALEVREQVRDGKDHLLAEQEHV